MISHNMAVTNPFFASQTNAQAAPQSSSNSNSSSNSSDPLGDSNTFISLLTAQLQAQDPLNPMSPSEMVDQLTQINSLEQLIQIQGDLQTGLGLNGASQASTPQANAVANTAQGPASQINSSPSHTLANTQ
jgi:flagellar hook assembly protein FlgD